MDSLMDTALMAKAKRVRCLICDVDGVLTNGHVYLSDNGVEYKSFHFHDGLGIKLLQQSGITVALITTSTGPALEKRVAQLGIEHCYRGQRHKQRAYDDLKTRLELADTEMAYIGDDLPDLAIIEQVGLGVAVANAVPLLLSTADYCTDKLGGFGAVREVCDLILLAQGNSDQALTDYLTAHECN